MTVWFCMNLLHLSRDVVELTISKYFNIVILLFDIIVFLTLLVQATLITSMIKFCEKKLD